MELHEEPSKRIPRTIPPGRHDNVWRLHNDGLNPRQIAEQLAASGCQVSRFSVRRLVIRLKRIQSREEHSRKVIEELTLARTSALALRETREEELSDVCDDLLIAVRKDRHDRVLALSRQGRLLFREVTRYDRLYQAAVKQESMLPRRVPAPPVPALVPVPAPAPFIRNAPVRRTVVARAVIGFALVASLLILVLFDLSCRSLVKDPSDPVKMPLAPAQTRTTRFDAPGESAGLVTNTVALARWGPVMKARHAAGVWP